MKNSEIRLANIKAVSLGYFEAPVMDNHMTWVPEGETHTFQPGDIAMIDCRNSWLKFGFTEEQPIEGPLVFANASGTTIEDIADERREVKRNDIQYNIAFGLVAIVISCVCLAGAGITFMGPRDTSLVQNLIAAAMTAYSGLTLAFFLYLGFTYFFRKTRWVQQAAETICIHPTFYEKNPLQAG